jgi:3-oxoadipate enol-lactonase
MKRLKRLFAALFSYRLFGPDPAPRFEPPQLHPWRIPGRTVFVGDEEFLVREAGPTDGPPVLLIHGLAGSSLAEWYRVGPLLADRFRLIMIDNRSHGLSPRTRTRFEIEDEADDIVAVLDVLDVGIAAVVGYSLGGAIAQALARRHPQRVSSLVLIATFSHHPPLWRLARSIGAFLTRAWERITGFGTAEVRSGYLLATGAVAPEHARWLWEESRRRDPDAGAQASLALLRFDSRDWVGRIKAPITVVIPVHDQLVPPIWQYGLAADIGTPEVVEVPGGRHELPWTHAELLADLIARVAGD